MMKSADRIALAHNPPALEKRWRTLARRAGVHVETLMERDGFPVLLMETPGAREGGVYISAGIHGDEPAGALGLLEWAESHGRSLSPLPLFLLPCLNPWGLQENSRRDAAGKDLNRAWHARRHPLVRAVARRLAGARFSLALTLHEDYDGNGVYIYEPIHAGRKGWSEILLAEAVDILPIDRRRIIDARRVPGLGFVRRRFTPENTPVIGPEALFLHFEHADRTFTFETPSEFDLDLRVEVQRRLIEKAVALALPAQPVSPSARRG